MKRSTFEKYCLKALRGESSPAEKEHLSRLIEKSAVYKDWFREMEFLWNRMQPLRPEEPFPVEKSWQALQARLEAKSESADKGRAVRKIILPGYFTSKPGDWLRTVAVAAAAIIIIIAGGNLFFGQHTTVRYSTLQTANRQKTQYTMSDGSVVTLNCGSSLRYNRNFGRDSREVYLEGEAFFRVVHNGHPFIVITNNAQTTVLGTEFNVRSRNDMTRVVVKSGCVRLECRDNKDEVILTDNQMSKVAGESKPADPTTVSLDKELSWLEGRLVFEKTPVWEILGELERAYDVPITLGDSSLGTETVTASYEQVDLETVLTSICLTLGTEFKKLEDGYIITR